METRELAICGCNEFGKVTKNGKVVYWVCKHGWMYDFKPVRLDKASIPPAPKGSGYPW